MTAPLRRRPNGEARPRLVRAGLTIAHLLRRPLEVLGVRFRPFVSILEARLVMDARRLATRGAALGSGGGDLADSSAAMTLKPLLLVLFGGFIGILAGVVKDPVLSMAVMQAFMMFYVASALVVDFTNVLFDTSDATVILPRPVDGRTALAARLAHIILYLGQMVAALSVGPIIVGSLVFTPWIFIPVFLVSVTLSTLIATLLATIGYLLAMRLFDQTRVKDFITWAQIAMMAGMFAANQVFPRFMFKPGGVWEAADHPVFAIAFPPLWYGGLFDLALGHATPVNWVLAALAVVVPVIAGWAALRLATSTFVEGLSKLASDTTDRRPRAAHKRGWMDAIRDRVTTTQLERAGFDYFRSLSRRERRFRLAAWPALVMGIASLVALGFTPGSTPSRAVFAASYVFFFVPLLPAIFSSAKYTDTPDAAWVFAATPISRYRPFVAGALKSFLVGFAIPVLGVVGVVAAIIGGPRSIPSVVFAVVATLAGALAFMILIPWSLPFSRQFVARAGGGSPILLLLGFLAGGVGALINGFFWQAAGAMWVAAACAAAAVVVLLRNLQNVRLDADLRVAQTVIMAQERPR